ncbi:MAG: hypothetical protein ACR2MD_03205 [Aridibacter sp.]
MKITWNKNIEPENKAEIEKYLDPIRWLIPRWCQKLVVSLWDSDGDGAAISTDVNYDYRNIELDFYSNWMLPDSQTKQENIIHECVHFFICPLYNQAQRFIENSADNDDTKKFKLAELAITNESITQDLSYAIGNKFGSRTFNDIEDILAEAAESEEGLTMLKEFYEKHPSVNFIVK